MKTVKCKRTEVVHLADREATLCGLLRYGRWTHVGYDAKEFIKATALSQCERCRDGAVRAL